MKYSGTKIFVPYECRGDPAKAGLTYRQSRKGRDCPTGLVTGETPVLPTDFIFMVRCDFSIMDVGISRSTMPCSVNSTTRRIYIRKDECHSPNTLYKKSKLIRRKCGV